MVFFLQILDDSRLSNFALDYKIVNCIDVLYRYYKDRSVYRLAHIWLFAWMNWGTFPFTKFRIEEENSLFRTVCPDLSQNLHQGYNEKWRKLSVLLIYLKVSQSILLPPSLAVPWPVSLPTVPQFLVASLAVNNVTNVSRSSFSSSFTPPSPHG